MDILSKREKFSSELITLLAMLSGSVGIGSIIKFPTTVAENGGAIFIFFYFIGLIFIGIPAFFGELLIGKKGHSNVINSYVYSGKNKVWAINGVLSAIASLLVLTFYSLFASWILRYFCLASFGCLDNVSLKTATDIFENFLNSSEPYVWFVLFVIIVGIISSMGIKNGLEKAIKFLIPIFLVVLVVLIIKSFVSSGASSAIKFLLFPDFAKLNFAVIINAIGLSFFKLTLGSGVMVTYGSYSGKQFNILKNCFKVAFLDLVISILMGFIVFSSFFSADNTESLKQSGFGLLFETIPVIFNNSPIDKLFLIIFFGAIFFVALLGALPLIEVTISTLQEKSKFNRLVASFLIVFVLCLLGIIPSLSGSIFQFLSERNLHLFICKTQINGIINIIDKIICNFILPVSGIGTMFLVGYKIKEKRVKKEIKKYIRNEKITSFFYYILKLSPILLLLIVLHSSGILS